MAVQLLDYTCKNCGQFVASGPNLWIKISNKYITAGDSQALNPAAKGFKFEDKEHIGSGELLGCSLHVVKCDDCSKKLGLKCTAAVGDKIGYKGRIYLRAHMLSAKISGTLTEVFLDIKDPTSLSLTVPGTFSATLPAVNGSNYSLADDHLVHPQVAAQSSDKAGSSPPTPMPAFTITNGNLGAIVIAQGNAITQILATIDEMGKEIKSLKQTRPSMPNGTMTGTGKENLPPETWMTTHQPDKSAGVPGSTPGVSRPTQMARRTESIPTRPAPLTKPASEVYRPIITKSSVAPTVGITERRIQPEGVPGSHISEIAQLPSGNRPPEEPVSQSPRTETGNHSLRDPPTPIRTAAIKATVNLIDKITQPPQEDTSFISATQAYLERTVPRAGDSEDSDYEPRSLSRGDSQQFTANSETVSSNGRKLMPFQYPTNYEGELGTVTENRMRGGRRPGADRPAKSTSYAIDNDPTPLWERESWDWDQHKDGYRFGLGVPRGQAIKRRGISSRGAANLLVGSKRPRVERPRDENGYLLMLNGERDGRSLRRKTGNPESSRSGISGPVHDRTLESNINAETHGSSRIDVDMRDLDVKEELITPKGHDKIMSKIFPNGDMIAHK